MLRRTGRGGTIVEFFLNQRFRYIRLVILAILSSLIFISLWGVYGNPIGFKKRKSDAEIDHLYRECNKMNVEKKERQLGIFIPFDKNQIGGVISNIQNWLKYDRCPCDTINETNRGKESENTDIIFFFLGDGQTNPELYPSILSSLSMPNSTNSATTILPCFNAVLFKSYRDLGLPNNTSIVQLFYSLIGSQLLRKYSHFIWMDSSVFPIRPFWLPVLYKSIQSDPFWVLGAMTSSKIHDHYDRSYYHIHMNALYCLEDHCFSQFLSRVRNDYVETTPDIAMHLYRTDFANFREAQHMIHMFRYSRLFVALDGVSSITNDWTEAFFHIDDKHWSTKR